MTRSRLDSRPRLSPFGALVVGCAMVGAFVGAILGTPGASAFRWESPPPAGVVEVDVVARVGSPGSPAAWTARARIASDPATPAAALTPGVCRRVEPVVAPSDGPVADRVALLGALPASLRWDARGRAWTTEGPHSVVDPAFAIGDLAIDVGGVQVLASDAVRFGAMPEVTRVVRSPEGGVLVQWDPRTAEDPRVSVVGPAGPLECGSGAAAVTLPWWAAPAVGGEIVLGSTRERVTTLANGVVLVVRARIERVVPLDAPDEQAGERPPGRETPLPGRPARPSSRPPRPIFG